MFSASDIMLMSKQFSVSNSSYFLKVLRQFDKSDKANRETTEV